MAIDALHPSSAGLAHYDASKHGVWGFTKNIALELAPHRIWVNAIAPGGIATPGAQQAQAGARVPAGADMNKLLDAFLARIPMARMGEPDDIGKVALFLASDLSSYIQVARSSSMAECCSREGANGPTVVYLTGEMSSGEKARPKHVEPGLGESAHASAA